jgi:phosphate acyltransferase
MGSDTSPQLLFEAVVLAAQKISSVDKFVVIATQDIIQHASTAQILAQEERSAKKVEFFPVSDVITMSDEPLAAIRHKKGSSLSTGIRLLKKHQIDALVSAGNTGALIAGLSLSIPRLPNIHRPALLAMLPTESTRTAVIDVGGSVACKAHHLVQFARMGAAVQRCRGIIKPRIGLLNIGVESKKGTAELRTAYQILQQEALSTEVHFEGNIEAREAMLGAVDVLVTDGFTGNVLIKTIEGTSAFILNSILSKCKLLPADQLTNTLQQLFFHFDHDEYPGAIVCGIEGVAIKCHGNSSPKAFFNAIKEAVLLVQTQLVSRIKEQL